MQTTHDDGLLAYTEGQRGEFIAMELVDGRLVVVAARGSRVPQVFSHGGRLDDNKWHVIHLQQVGERLFNLTLDETFTNQLRIDQKLTLGSNIHIASVPPNIFQSLSNQVTSTSGYAGCLASVVIHSRLYDVINDASSPPEFVVTGCQGWSS